MLRALQPMDLVALASRQRSLVDEAQPRGQLEHRERHELPPSSLVWDCLPWGKGRRTWVWLDRGQICGLVSIRYRQSGNTWEVAHLCLRDLTLGQELLDRLSWLGGERGVERIFLRLPQDSPLLEVAQRSGFSGYLRESLFRSSERQPKNALGAPSLTLRPHYRRDELGLFQLYNAAVPLAVRQARGLTFVEWGESQEKPLQRGPFHELVGEKEGQVVGWVRLQARGERGSFELLAHPGAPSVSVALLDYCLGNLEAPSRSIFCLAAEFQRDLQEHLRQRGFEEVAQYSLLVKKTTARVRQTCLAPVRA